MSVPRYPVVLLLLLVGSVSAMGTLLLRQRAATNEWEARALTAEARRQAEQVRAVRLRAKVAKVEERADKLESVIAAEHDETRRAHKAAKEQARAEAKAVAAVAAGAAMVGPAGGKEPLDVWLASANDPVVLRRLNEQARLQTLKRYGALMDQLTLTPEQREELTRLLTDERQVALDIAVSSFQGGADPRQDPATYLDMIAATRQDLDAQVHALLGDAGYQAYQNFDRSAGQAQVLGRLDQLLRGINAPLTPAQATQLQQTMQVNDTGRVTAKVVKDAQAFLTPAQMQTLRDLRAIQQANSRKRNQPVPALPVGEGGK